MEASRVIESLFLLSQDSIKERDLKSLTAITIDEKM
jgi:hypothetical protein